jgi:translation initiation factor IF-2
MRVPLFDRQRMVGEVLCLEPEQQESRRALDASDELYVIIEGRARIRAGPQIEDLEALDCVFVPPGVERFVTNPGPERLVALVVVAPKPTRAGEVRMPREDRPLRTARRDEDNEHPRREEAPFRRPAPRSYGPPRSAPRPYAPRREPVGDRDERSANPRARPAPYAGNRRPAGPPRDRGFRPPRDGEAVDGESRPARMPRPYAGSRPTGASRGPARFGAPGGGPTGAGRPASGRSGPRREAESGSRTSRPARPSGAAGRPPAGGGNRRAPGGSPAPRGPANRGGSGPRRSPGRPSGRPGPGRSGPRTSGPR